MLETLTLPAAGGVAAIPAPHGVKAPRRKKPAYRPAPRSKRIGPTTRAAEVPSLASRRLQGNQTIVEPQGNRSACYRVGKRLLDVLGGGALIVLLSPILLLVFIALAVTMKGRPLFVQMRIGYLGKRFPMFKFRTMRLGADRLQHLVENHHTCGPIFKNRRDPRITRLGHLLRRTSIDELPQLLNVLLGHMSLVGPRPPVEKEVAQYETWHRRRLAVKPGLTCLWQVSGRSEIGFEDWVRLDLWYIENQDLHTDVNLLLRTPWSVLTGRGAY